MGHLLEFSFLVSLGTCSAFVCCGLLALVSRVPLLVARQRATLYGVQR